jgi:hypothetical protein
MATNQVDAIRNAKTATEVASAHAEYSASMIAAGQTPKSIKDLTGNK